MEQQIIRDRQWEEIARLNDEATASPVRVEVELWHYGDPQLIFAKIRKIAEYEDKESGLRAETYECMTKKDIPPKFTVLLHNGTVLSHVQMCKFRHTDFGSRLISRAITASLLTLDVLLLLALTGVLPAEVNLTDWYWMLTIGGIFGIMVGVALYDRSAVVGRLVLECAYPGDERGSHHVCYVCHSKAGNVIEQLNAFDRYRDSFDKLITGLVKHIDADNVAVRDYAYSLESKLDDMVDDIKVRVVREADQRVGLRPRERVVGLNLGWVALLVAAVIIAVFGVGWYVFGGH